MIIWLIFDIYCWTVFHKKEDTIFSPVTSCNIVQFLPHTVNCVRFCSWRCLWLFCLCMKKYLWNRWTDLCQIHREDVFGPLLGRVWMSRSKVKVTTDKKLGFRQISLELLNWFATDSQGRHVWSLARSSLKVSVKGQGYHGQKMGFQQISWELLNGFAINSHRRLVWSLTWTSLEVKVNFGSLHAVCLEKHLCSSSFNCRLNSKFIVKLLLKSPSHLTLSHVATPLCEIWNRYCDQG